jgi:hypothetical protein
MGQQHRRSPPGDSALYQLGDKKGEEESQGDRLPEVPRFWHDQEKQGDADGENRSAEVGNHPESAINPRRHPAPAQCLNDELIGERQSFDERANKNLLVVIADKGRPGKSPGGDRPVTIGQQQKPDLPLRQR